MKWLREGTPPAVSSSLVLTATLLLVLAVVVSALAGCSSDDSSPSTSPAPEPSPSGSKETSASPSATSTDGAPTATDPVSVLGVAAQRHTGDQLRLGAVRQRTSDFTSYDVSYRVRSSGPGARTEPLRITGVLNVPTGEGPFPVVVLAHGYVDPAVYKSGQGMTRERGFLAERGYIALHVDYRGHAGSDPDPSNGTDARLGYAVDVLGAIDALKGADLPRVPVDDSRVAVFGRSMGGGVVQKVAEIVPDAAGAAVAWAAVSSLEAENFNHFIRADNDPRRERIVQEHGLPEDDPEFWLAASARPYFDRITAPVLSVHGRRDDTCPPRWTRATEQAMQEAGVDSELAWYDDGHAFGPAFVPAMERTVSFLDDRLG